MNICVRILAGTNFWLATTLNVLVKSLEHPTFFFMSLFIIQLEVSLLIVCSFIPFKWKQTMDYNIMG